LSTRKALFFLFAVPMTSLFFFSFSRFKRSTEFSPGNFSGDHFQSAGLGVRGGWGQLLKAMGSSGKGWALQGAGKGGCSAPQRRRRAGLGSVPAAGAGLAPSAGGEFPREDSFRSLQASEKLKLGTRTSAIVRGKRERPWEVSSKGSLARGWVTVAIGHHFGSKLMFLCTVLCSRTRQKRAVSSKTRWEMAPECRSLGRSERIGGKSKVCFPLFRPHIWK